MKIVFDHDSSCLKDEQSVLIEILHSCRLMNLALKRELPFDFLEDNVDNAALKFYEGTRCHLFVVGRVEKRGQFVYGQN